MVALTADDLTGTRRGSAPSKPDGSWGPWYEAETLEGVGPTTRRTAPRGTDPVFVGRTTDRADRGHPPRRRPGHAAAPADRAGQARTGLRARPTSNSPGAEHQRRADQPAAGTGRHAVDAADGGRRRPGSRPTSSAARSGAPTRRCAAETPCTTTASAPAIVHHTAGSNDYAPEDSAAIVRSIYAYHTRTLGWCDIAYNALVDKYGQVFEGRAGGIDQAGRGLPHRRLQPRTPGVWRCSATSTTVPPTPTSSCAPPAGCSAGGWAWTASTRRGTVVLASAGGSFTHFPRGATPTLPTIFTHRDVGNTDCPGNAAYAAMDQIRDIAARFNDPPGPRTWRTRCAAARSSPSGSRWAGRTARSARRRHPRPPATARRATSPSSKGAIYWSPESGAEPVTGAIYEAWGVAGLRARRARPADQRRDPGTAVDRAELPARHAELRPREGHRDPGRSTACPQELAASRRSMDRPSSSNGSPRIDPS